MALDYASIMRGGQALVPDIRQQIMEREVLDLQRGQAALQQNAAALKQAEMLREQQEQENFQRDLDEALLDGSPQAIQRLMLRYPAMAKNLQPAWEAMDERQRAADLTQTGTIFARANAGDFAGAAAALRARVEADRAAGVADPTDEAVLAGLESDNPIEQRAAMATIGIQLAALTPDKFADTYGKLSPDERLSPKMREYEDRVARFGKAAADEWLATEDVRLIAPEPGASVYDYRDFIRGAPSAPAPAQARGGDPASTAVPATGSAIEQAALSAVPGLRVTSRRRSPERNRQVGGTANSYHLTDQARDFVPPAGMSMGQLASRLKQALPGFDVINEGDHVHVEPGRGMARGGPVQVRTKQQYDKLAPGTPYIAPDGSQRVKS